MLFDLHMLTSYMTKILVIKWFGLDPLWVFTIIDLIWCKVAEVLIVFCHLMSSMKIKVLFELKYYSPTVADGKTFVLFTHHCRRQNFCANLLLLRDRLYTVIWLRRIWSRTHLIPGLPVPHFLTCDSVIQDGDYTTVILKWPCFKFFKFFKFFGLKW